MKYLKSIFSLAVIIIPAIFFGYRSQPTEMGIMVVASSIAVAFLNIDKMQKIKGAGFEAEMKKVIDEGYITIDNLRSVALPLIVAAIDTISWGKRWGTSESGRDERMFNKLTEIVGKLDLDNVEIVSAMEEYYSLKIMDHYSSFINSYAKSQLSKGIEQKKVNEIQILLREIIDFRKHSFPSKNKILNTLGNIEEDLSEEVKDLLTDYVQCLQDDGVKISKLIIRD